MNSDFTINVNSQKPVYKQLMECIQNLVETGIYKSGDFLPSMNELAANLDISKETVKKAYSILREKGLIDSSHGKGFFISSNRENKIRILVLFDKISSYKQALFNSFADTVGSKAEITIRLHNQDVDLFEYFIDENLNKFDYYIITPHFPFHAENDKRVLKALKRIPNRKLLVLDKYISELPGNYGSVYQDFENDVYDGLKQGLTSLKKFNKLNVISMPGSLYSPLIEKGIRKFCGENDISFEIFKNMDTAKITKKEVFLILNSQLDDELIELVRYAKSIGLKIGKDIGIISYNDSPINEIILDGLTVLSTDFAQMGVIAAKMILDKKFSKIKCEFKLVQRSTF